MYITSKENKLELESKWIEIFYESLFNNKNINKYLIKEKEKWNRLIIWLKT